MERSAMGELNMRGQAGTRPSFSDVARGRGLHRQTAAKCWRAGEEVGGRRSDRESGFERVRGAVKECLYSIEAERHSHPELSMARSGN